MASDWYRRKVWTTQDEDDFLARLKRSRSRFHRAQYLHIQAGELIETGIELNLQAALKLLELVLTDYPEPSQLAITYWQLARCNERMRKPDEAVQAYRNALRQQRDFPNAITNAHIGLALLIAKQARRSEYDEALQALNEWGRLGDFPILDFEICAVRAMICSDTGQQDAAAKWAVGALCAAKMTHSGYRYHATLGLVGSEQAEMVRRMEAISAKHDRDG